MSYNGFWTSCYTSRDNGQITLDRICLAHQVNSDNVYVMDNEHNQFIADKSDFTAIKAGTVRLKGKLGDSECEVIVPARDVQKMKNILE